MRVNDPVLSTGIVNTHNRPWTDFEIAELEEPVRRRVLLGVEAPFELMVQPHTTGRGVAQHGGRTGDLVEPRTAEIAGKAMENSYWINHLAPEDTALKPFFAAYRKKYNDECKEFANGVLAYDSMYWLADAVKRAGKADPKAIAKALESTKGLKLLHATITIDPATHTPLDKVGVVLVAKEGKSMLFKKIKP